MRSSVGNGGDFDEGSVWCVREVPPGGFSKMTLKQPVVTIHAICVKQGLHCKYECETFVTRRGGGSACFTFVGASFASIV